MSKTLNNGRVSLSWYPLLFVGFKAKPREKPLRHAQASNRKKRETTRPPGVSLPGGPANALARAPLVSVAQDGERFPHLLEGLCEPTRGMGSFERSQPRRVRGLFIKYTHTYTETHTHTDNMAQRFSLVSLQNPKGGAR